MARGSSAAGRLAGQLCGARAGLRRDQSDGIISGTGPVLRSRAGAAATCATDIACLRGPMPLFTLDQLESAAKIVRRFVLPTPAYAWPLLAQATGVEVIVTHENHTPTGAFKARGGLTKRPAGDHCGAARQFAREECRHGGIWRRSRDRRQGF